MIKKLLGSVALLALGAQSAFAASTTATVNTQGRQVDFQIQRNTNSGSSYGGGISTSPNGTTGNATMTQPINNNSSMTTTIIVGPKGVDGATIQYERRN